MADGIHDLTVADCQKNPSEELIVLWIAGALSDISEQMIESSFFECVQIMIFFFFFMLAVRNHFLCFLVAILFFPKCSPKWGCILYTGTHYTRVNMVLKETHRLLFSWYDG